MVFKQPIFLFQSSPIRNIVCVYVKVLNVLIIQLFYFFSLKSTKSL